MNKLMRAGLEAITTIVLTLGVVVGAFGMMFGYENLLALSGLYYGVWAVAILISDLALASRRRHLRLGIGVAISGAVMIAHLVMYLMGGIATEITLVPVILHDFGFAIVSLIALSLVHLVIFRRSDPQDAPAPHTAQIQQVRQAPPVAPPASPSASERVTDLPEPAAAAPAASPTLEESNKTTQHA